MKVFDYSKLCGRIKEVFNTQERFASAIALSNASLSAKLNNRTPFTQKDILRSVHALKLDAKDVPAYFFRLKVEKPQHY